MTPNPQSVSTEELLRLVADPQRRAVLSCLLDRDGATASVEELAAALVAAEVRVQRSAEDGEATARPQAGKGRSGQSTTDDGTLGGSVAVERASIGLRHNHLPKLAEAGVVDYDHEGGTVRYRPHEEVEELLAFIAERADEQTSTESRS